MNKKQKLDKLRHLFNVLNEYGFNIKTLSDSVYKPFLEAFLKSDLKKENALWRSKENIFFVYIQNWPKGLKEDRLSIIKNQRFYTFSKFKKIKDSQVYIALIHDLMETYIGTKLLLPIEKNYFWLFGKRIPYKFQEHFGVISIYLENQVLTIKSSKKTISKNIIKFMQKSLEKYITGTLDLFLSRTDASSFPDWGGYNIQFKSSKSKWASLSCKKNITNLPYKRTFSFSYNLAVYEKEYIDVIIWHEIAHIYQQNHSKNFYNVLEKLIPSYKVTKKLFDENLKCVPLTKNSLWEHEVPFFDFDEI
ncbi:YgjP-like metallopeptidase domain-containing protein [Mycoplasma sp. Ms02]|uniref:YgjP-like metallopeptidase domain-containing protein n=1 Tax=Mycoplasma sp. Ms02 TaxID=353851 RepID=UPI001C8987C6|nr:YgjP-like metallopeptidase domain-containing protein [Mycoplasma sp. Ms02]QZE12261.1 M48 family metallopeptidase [Mycoplasma sp. Ms02]